MKVKCKKSEKHQLHLLWTYCVSRYGVISKIYLLPPGGSDAYTGIVFKMQHGLELGGTEGGTS